MHAAFLAALERIVRRDAILRDETELLAYESDGLARLRERPGLVVLPNSAEEVPGVVLIVLTRLNRILDVDIPNQRITVEPGVVNLEVSRSVAPHGFYYAPDPSSQQICSIGGNVAENSGGAHCLKYGFTVHHVVGLELVLPNGEMVHVGGSAVDLPGLDLVGVLVGSEGTLGVVTKATLRLLRIPETVRTILAAF